MNPYEGKRVLVVGLGASGAATAEVLSGLGASVRVTEASSSSEMAERARELITTGVEVEIGGHDLDHLDADLAVVSPGIPPTSPIVSKLVAAGVPLVSEVEVAYRLAGCDFLAVTGTNGKTTTTSLLASMLSEGGIATVAAGNIGYPLIKAISEVSRDGAIAVEVSSFQLATIERFKPKVAVLLNIAEDHMDWHGSFDDYAAAKARIVANQTSDDVFVPNHDDSESMQIAKSAPSRVVPFSGTSLPEGGPSAGVMDDHLVWRKTKIVHLDEIPLPGMAGIEDAAAAATAALEYGVEVDAAARAIRAFRPLAHRLEVVAVADGVTYVDDSKATNPHATLTAVRGMGDVVLIAGGRSKGIDLAALKGVVPPVVAVVAIGESAPEVLAVFEGLVPTERATSMEEAVAMARAQVRPGGSVLLSPGCASLDMYESYAARGDHFAGVVTRLLAENNGSE